MYVCCLQSRSCLALIRCVWQGGREQYSSKPKQHWWRGLLPQRPLAPWCSWLYICCIDSVVDRSAWRVKPCCGSMRHVVIAPPDRGTPLFSLANSPCAKHESVPTLRTRFPLWISLHPCTCHLAFHPLQVTVYESLVFSARLRLPEENGGKVALVSRAACCMYSN